MRAEVHADLVRAARCESRPAPASAPAEVLGADDARDRLAAAAHARRCRRHLLAVRRDRGRSARRCGGRPCTSPQTSARYSFSTSRSRTAARAPRAPRRAWRRPSAPTCPRSSRCTMPGRFSPPMPLRSSTWWSSALTSVPLACPAAGCTTMPAGLSTTIEIAILVDDRQRQRLRPRRRVDRLRDVDRDRPGPASTGLVGLRRASGDPHVAVLDQPLDLRARLLASTDTRNTIEPAPALSSGTVSVCDRHDASGPRRRCARPPSAPRFGSRRGDARQIRRASRWRAARAGPR